MVTIEPELITTDEDIVRVALCYNAFDVTNPVREELVYKEGQNLTTYIVGLPDTCEWKVGLNGVAVPEEEYDTRILEPNDLISIVAVPQGSAKDILRMVAQLAVVAAAVFVGFAIGGPWGAIAAAAIVMVGFFLVNILIPPAKPKTQKDDGEAYGYDGARNTAREGIPIPVIYGKYWIGGNYVDLFSENSGDNQFLYGRIVMSDGEIDSLFDEPYLGEIPISDYQDVQWGFTHGTPTEPVNPRFGQAKAHYQRQDKLETGEWVEYTTTTDIDQFQLNFLFPQGIVHYQKDGDKETRDVDLEVQYAPYGTSTWTGPGTTPSPTQPTTTFPGGVTSPLGGKFDIQMQAQAPATLTPESTTYELQYSPAGAGTWTTIKEYTDTTNAFVKESSFLAQEDRFGIAVPTETTDKSIYPVRTAQVELPEGTYDFRTVTTSGTATVDIVKSTVQSTVTPGSTGTQQIEFEAKTSKTLRRSYTSPTLVHGRYHIRVRRTNTDRAVEDRSYDDVYLNDVAEILHAKVGMRNIATGWYVARMTDQLQGVPTILWPVKGVKVPIYDANGTVTSTEWSENPADIVLDMLVSEKRGALRDKIEIDFPAYVEWREYCATEGLKFNGVFDGMETLWDQSMEVYKVGRAIPVRIGSKLSVAVDKPTEPSMLFGPGNIYTETFQIQYLPLQERAVEFEASYYDISDRNKKKTIRIADPDAAQAGQIPKTAQFDLFGVDNFEQAQKHVWWQLYNNRLIRRVVTFDAPVESIGISIGDVALIQHDLMKWGEGGRVKSGNTTTQVNLDKVVEIEAAKTYKLLVNHSKLQKLTGSINLAAGTTYTLTGLSSTSHDESTLKRLVTDTGDEAAVEIWDYTGGSTATVVLSANVTGTTFTVWDVDVIEERTVTTGVSETDVVNVTPAFSQAPEAYSNFMFGEEETVKRPYRLTSITGDAFERRTLTFGEYNEFTYSPPETEIPEPDVQPPKVPTHVTNLTVNVSPIRTPGGQATAILSWVSDGVYRYAGADVYISRDGDDYTFLQTVQNTNQLMVLANDGEFIKLKVVAFNDMQLRANINTAPHVEVQINTAAATLEEPTNLVWTITRIGYDATGLLTWLAGIPTGTIPNISNIHRVQVKYDTTTEWLDKGTTNELQMELKNMPAGAHILRIRSENTTGAISDWVTLEFSISAPTLAAPTFVTNNSAMDHDINTDGSVNMSVEWEWAGNEDDIDGFQVISFQNGSNVEYFLGNQPGQENIFSVAAEKRIHWFYGLPADKWYTVYVRAFRFVHPSFAAGGILYSAANKPSLANENPYRPEENIAFGGDVTGTIGGVPVEDIIGEIGDTAPPGIPSGLALSSSVELAANGDKWIKLLATWTPSVDSDLRGYVLAIKENDGEFIEFLVDKTVANFFWSVLPSTEYTAKLAAYDNRGNTSGFTAEVSHTTLADTIPPAAPTGLSILAGITNLYLSWTNPSDTDILHTEVYESLTDDSAAATRIATVNALPSAQGRFTRSGIPTGQTRYYWVKGRDRSGNTSNFSVGATGTTLMVGTEDIAANTIVANHIAAHTITADEIAAGSITGDRISTGTSLPGTITIDSTGVTLATLAAGGGGDPADTINSNTTLILPGRILISGSTTLENWRFGPDLTDIDGGAIGANSITANKLNIGLRGLTFSGLQFQANRQITASATEHTNYIAWSEGTITYKDNNGDTQNQAISASYAQWTGGTLYIYWVYAAATLSISTSAAIATDPANVILCTYRGGTDMVNNYGRTIIDGSHITTNSINANRIQAGTVLADNILVGSSGLTAGDISGWTNGSDFTYIDGGAIYANSITATQLSSSTLITTSAQIGTLTVDTLHIKGNALTVPLVVEGSDTTISSTTLQDIITTSTITVGDATDGKALISVFGWQDLGVTVDAGAQIELHVSKNGGAYELLKTTKVGSRTDGGNTYSYIPFNMVFMVDAVTTVAVKLKAKQVAMPGSFAKPSVIRDPAVIIQGAKR